MTLSSKTIRFKIENGEMCITLIWYVRRHGYVLMYVYGIKY